MKVTVALAAAGVLSLALAACSPGVKCSPTSCNGCCTAAGTCSRGTSSTECGTSGATCAACSGSDTCNAGRCGSAAGGSGGSGGGTGTGGMGTGGGTVLASCGPSSCADGCCEGATCVRGTAQSAQACGTGGAACGQCVGGNSCANGLCSGGAPCDSTTCPSGCCTGNACLGYGAQGIGACGTGGGACMPCAANLACGSGVCSTPAVVGQACTLSMQCETLGAGAYCKRQTSSMNANYTSGFCTIGCATAGELCAAGQGTCIGGPTSIFSVYGEADRFCASLCPSPGNQSSCRMGYSCYGPSDGGFCWLSPVPPFDGGGIPDKLGNACASHAQCQNPPSADWGFCLVGTSDAGPTRFTGGYCTAECTYDNTGSFCGPNGSCRGFRSTLADGGASDAFGLCLRTCPSPGGGRSSLRPGGAYVCATRIEPDAGVIGVLWPACDQPSLGAASCPAQTYCDVPTGYCCDGGVCIK